MILLTRLNGATIGVNADLIERIDSTPDTVITLVDGKKYLVTETTDEVVQRIVHFRARVLAAVDECTAFPAGDFPTGEFSGEYPPARAAAAAPGRALRLVSGRDEDR
jgi:flagellar protein FlbD